MNLSIRQKLFFSLTGLIIFFTILSWAMVGLFLESYYYDCKKNTLLDSYKKIIEAYKKQPEEFALILEQLENLKGIRIVILDKNISILYDTSVKESKFRNKGRTIENQISTIQQVTEKLPFILSGKNIIEKRFDSRLNSNFIALYSLLENEYILYLNAPIEAIRESTNIAQKFTVFTGLITILLGGLIIYFFSAKFTRPILELNEIAKKMAYLDFSQKYKVERKDELGTLGESINSLSEQLQKSISELQQANQKLIKDIERERKIDEMRKEFVANVSHELKTPIALIQGYAEGLKLNINDDEESKNFYCDVITDEAQKMNKMVLQLLDLSCLESGIVLEKSAFKINELIDSVIKKKTIILNEKNISVSVYSEKDYEVYADYERIEQVLINYLTNAINHVDEQKIIKISVEKQRNYISESIANRSSKENNETKKPEDPKEHKDHRNYKDFKEDTFTSNSENNSDKMKSSMIRVKVFNSGNHIPEEALDKIWNSFYKVDKARTRSYGGTGIGLSIVRAIMQAHEGSYGVKNVDGGVEFWFDLSEFDNSIGKC